MKNETPCSSSKKLISKCGARTRRGSLCSNHPIQGRTRCKLHGGASTGPRTPEGKASIAKAAWRHGRYVGYRAMRRKESRYRNEVERILSEAKAAGLL